MRQTYRYSKLKSITYKFTRYEIFEALVKAHAIKDASYTDFEIDDDGMDGATLIINCQTVDETAVAKPEEGA